jgi:hypothetical protein
MLVHHLEYGVKIAVVAVLQITQTYENMFPPRSDGSMPPTYLEIANTWIKAGCGTTRIFIMNRRDRPGRKAATRVLKLNWNFDR